MSKLFFDHLIILEDLETEIKEVAESPEEKEELWQLIDEILHHRILGCILDSLPAEHHHNFLEMFHQSPHDERIIHFLNKKIEGDIEKLIEKEVADIKNELLADIKGKKNA